MIGRTGIAAASAALCFVGGSHAWAQTAQTTTVVTTERTPTYLKTPVPAPRRAFELGISTGYTQPFGELSEGRPIADVVDQGIGFGIDLGYRFSPRWSLGLDATYHESKADDLIRSTTNVRGGTAGIKATYHLAPYERIDPYVALGTGYRMLWRVNEVSPDLTTHGFELGKLQLGLDVRASKDIAVGPFVGADINMFTWNNLEGPAGNVAVQARRVSSFFYAGVQGRFDLGGTREVARETTYALTPVRTYFVSDVNDTERQARENASKRSGTGLVIDSAILSACGIKERRTYFAFDSADVTGNDASTLDRVSVCLTTGPLKGRQVEIVGHTDPRGTDDYNQRLGYSRAESVSRYLTAKGVPSPNMKSESVGERQATGTEPEGWAHDRRVDIRLMR